ncbi:MAG: hypothetical protein JRI68_07970 [Deltaproteobacteria bacterium]|nr:hypothetical protein [Deltaproteobacteria bacterium]
MTTQGSALCIAAALVLAACGGEDEWTPSAGGAGGGGGTGGSGNSTGGSDPNPPTADCESLELHDMTGATEVATEEALRTALAAGGLVQLTADLTASSHFDVGPDTVFDGGGHTISGGGTTHLFVSRMVHFTIQNAVVVDGNNQVSDDEHFARRSGAAVMANGGNGTSDGPATGSLTVIDVDFSGHVIKPEGPGDLRGGAVYVFNLPDVQISGATFQDNEGSNGGAIGGLGSAIKIVNSSFVNNRTNFVGSGGAGEGNGGAISLDAMSQNDQEAHLHICGCDFRNNLSLVTGGAVSYVAHWYTDTDVIIDQCVFENNRTTSAEHGQGGAIFAMDDEKAEQATTANSLSISNTTFSGNQTWGSGGGVWFWTKDGRLTLTNATFADNRIDDGNDTGMGGALAISQGPTDILNVTIANNWAKFHGGGIQAGGDAVVTLTNTLFYNNTSDREGGWANFHTNREVDHDGGGNMQWLDESAVIDSNSNALVSENATIADPLLEALADNGGPGHTMALGAGSPAIDAGVANAPDTDQRGLPRDDTPDIGAFEVQP